ncbi:complement regulator-acquiring protein [Borreliella garinii]
MRIKINPYESMSISETIETFLKACCDNIHY